MSPTTTTTVVAELRLPLTVDVLVTVMTALKRQYADGTLVIITDGPLWRDEFMVIAVHRDPP